MDNTPITVSSFPRAILHLDGDAFFTSVEQALNPALRGKPVVTGKERGIIACASYEAKALGIKRGIPLFQARKMCPELVILPDDYETYGLYSQRMFNIIRHYTPFVEEYSVDEAFADITGMRRVFHCSYEELALRIQADIQRELGLTVSVGLSLSKALAKLCSKFRKPRGFTAVQGKYIHLLLQRTPLATVWGFGPNTVSLLEKLGLKTAYDFVMKPPAWADRLLHKPGRELWSELRGDSVWKVNPEEKSTYGSIMKSKTFTPPSSDRAFVFAKLVRNLESALMKARHHHLRPRMIGVVLRHQDFRHDGLEAKLSRATAAPLELTPLVRELFDRIFREGCEYRSTLVLLGALENDRQEQYDLFEDRARIDTLQRITRAVDTVNEQFGKHTVGVATGLYLHQRPPSDRDAAATRPADRLLPGETARQHLAIPRMNICV